MEPPTTQTAPSHSRKRKFHDSNPPGPAKTTKPTKVPPDKRRKRQDAREISAQTSEVAFRDGQFDPVSFVNSREYEIKSFLRSMNSSKNAQRKRAFQSLPRELRRRTAAHNSSRVPKRVREIARKELAEDNTTVRKKRRDYRPGARRLNANQLRMLSTRGIETSSRSQQPTSNGPGKIRSYITSKSSRYRKRQRHKTWLPTHIWSAKRARMVCKWGFSLAETPNLKCYRPTYRAATQGGCIAVDTSYYATILLEGQEKALKRSLARFLPPRDFAMVGRCVVSGGLARSTWMYEEGEWPKKPLTPIQVFWCPRGPSDGSKEQGLRKVVLRVHPASWDDAWRVTTACAATSDCTCKDLRFEVGSIGVMGPRTAVILKALLNLNTNFENMRVDEAIHGTGRDPRLNSFYLRTTALDLPSQESTPNTDLAGGLFDAKYRDASIMAQVSQKTLNSRISRLVSGESDRLVSDAEVPFALIREVVGTHAYARHSDPQPLTSHSWSILLPWKWVRPYWLVLMRMPGVRLGGLKELEQLTLEGGVGYFPTDFPSTNAGRVEALERNRARLDQVKRRSTMKTKLPKKRNGPEPSTESETNAGYMWGDVLAADIHFKCEDPEVWQLTPDLVQLFWKSRQSELPPSISSGVFAAHIRVYGPGNIDSDTLVYTFPEPASKLVPRMLLQYSRDRDPIDKILEILDGKNDSLESTRQSGWTKSSLAGFVVRGNFGFYGGGPVAIAALAWAKVHSGESSDTQDAFSGWCILLNKARKGAKRLAQWVAI
ncbi:hypothetical protein TWF481_000875 [Arthrobotrys musiformis]|uniref:Uncharacterized protein n=1 Tax=Arthrobotrys musiformis TaxID=47236 RepID=A0AAV9WQN7_9PEZI